MSNFLPVAMLAALQAQPAPPPPNVPESPIARIVVTPTTSEVTAGDTVRFTAEALDASGRRIENAIIRFVASGGQGEGSIDSTGTLIASSVGKMPINVVIARRDPAPVQRLVAGQQLRLAALPFTKVNDRARDAIRWTSSAPNVVRVDTEARPVGFGRRSPDKQGACPNSDAPQSRQRRRHLA